ncbi:MAG: LUD domain-containing protein [Candidatus Shapirobacteria bacterium]|nr:LUD domain-containing protein [Candidatus Shapirobacteria bacterium]
MTINKQSFWDRETKTALWRIVLEYQGKRDQALKKNQLEMEGFREEVHQMKKQALDQIDQLRKQAIANLEANGIRVFEAKDDNQARKIIEKLLKDKKRVIKAKTNAFGEIDQKGFLADKQVQETDLGDFVVSLVGDPEAHPVLPALHLSPEKIAQAIEKKYRKRILPTAEGIAEFARNYLREKINRAQAGITGANAITADGKIVILENEGNISLVSRWPESHIVVAGFEKIVPSLKEALMVVQASAIWGTGQDWPAYVSVIASPSKTADIANETIIGAQGAKEVNLVLLDNGRGRLIEAGFSELLHCLNCGACLNFCPVYHQIGSHYGGKYLGSRGVVFAAFSQSLKKAKLANCFACTLCSACLENCPAKIDLPELMRKLRTLLEKEGWQTKENEKMIANIRKFGNPFGKIEEGQIPKELYCC